jgi:hypothetical protein
LWRVLQGSAEGDDDEDVDDAIEIVREWRDDSVSGQEAG